MSSDGPSMAYMLQRERLRQEEERIKAMHAANEEWERARKAQERQLQLEEIQQRESALAAALLQHEQDKQQLRMNLEREGDPRAQLLHVYTPNQLAIGPPPTGGNATYSLDEPSARIEEVPSPSQSSQFNNATYSNNQASSSGYANQRAPSSYQQQPWASSTSQGNLRQEAFQWPLQHSDVPVSGWAHYQPPANQLNGQWGQGLMQPPQSFSQHPQASTSVPSSYQTMDLHPQYVSGQASTSHNAQPPMNTARGPVPAYYPTTSSSHRPANTANQRRPANGTTQGSRAATSQDSTSAKAQSVPTSAVPPRPSSGAAGQHQSTHPTNPAPANPQQTVQPEVVPRQKTNNKEILSDDEALGYLKQYLDQWSSMVQSGAEVRLPGDTLRVRKHGTVYSIYDSNYQLVKDHKDLARYVKVIWHNHQAKVAGTAASRPGPSEASDQAGSSAQSSSAAQGLSSLPRAATSSQPVMSGTSSLAGALKPPPLPSRVSHPAAPTVGGPANGLISAKPAEPVPNVPAAAPTSTDPNSRPPLAATQPPPVSRTISSSDKQSLLATSPKVSNQPPADPPTTPAKDASTEPRPAPRTPSQADKRTLASDILKALGKRPRVDEGLDQRPEKRKAVETAVVENSSNGKAIPRTVGPYSATQRPYPAASSSSSSNALNLAPSLLRNPFLKSAPTVTPNAPAQTGSIPNIAMPALHSVPIVTPNAPAQAGGFTNVTVTAPYIPFASGFKLQKLVPNGYNNKAAAPQPALPMVSQSKSVDPVASSSKTSVSTPPPSAPQTVGSQPQSLNPIASSSTSPLSAAPPSAPKPVASQSKKNRSDSTSSVPAVSTAQSQDPFPEVIQRNGLSYYRPQVFMKAGVTPPPFEDFERGVPSPAKTPLFLPSPSPSHASAIDVDELSQDDASRSTKSKGKQKASARGNHMYVLVPPAPDYVKRHQAAEARRKEEERSKQRSQKPGPSKSASSRNKSNTPVVVDPKERQAIEESCSRLRAEQCNWSGCRVWMNSAGNLLRHLKQHGEQQCTQKTFSCLWGQCERRFANGPDLMQHLEIHTQSALVCAYQDCDQSYRNPRQLMQHNLQHANHSLKRSASPFRSTEPIFLPVTPDVLPSYMVVARGVIQHSISRQRHEELGPHVLRNMMGQVSMVKRYNAARPFRPKSGAEARDSGLYDYDFLPSTASIQLSKTRGLRDLPSAEISELIAEGLVLWPPPETSTGVSVDQRGVGEQTPSRGEGSRVKGEQSSKS